ncbi:esterase E4 [Folsomia candida]|uniref:Carboxylic ester hydrolase n=1 Tax=Folsomia candida TaxID=158441 RepID=A0A226EFZ9_FOLCA|nr:esterase E4 [Folsomia candida]OXA56057.1 Esterase E4 [Folsomia candida]
MMSGISGSKDPIIDLPQGIVEGVLLQSRECRDYFGFYGIPFAKRCPERFQPPERWEKWSGLLDGKKPRERCAQASLITRRVLGSEDCLFLNVFTPQLPSGKNKRSPNSISSTNGLPVMVFIFGGGYYVGGGDLYGGKYLIDQDVILVTFNYRLGAFGFLNSGDGQVGGNMGMKDQVMCLRWVQENISYFGGDKDNVTLFGESAGAACVHFHLMSPMSKGLFHRGIMQSGNALSPWAFTKRPEQKVRDLVKQLGIECDLTDMTEMVKVLKEVNPYAIAAQRMDFTEWKEQPLIAFTPSAESGPPSDHTFLADCPLDVVKSNRFATQVPLMMGVNAQEGAYRAIPLLQNPSRLQAANSAWFDEAPKHLIYDKSSLPTGNEFASAVRKFYFGDKLISPESRGRLIDMFSDRFFIHSTKTTALYHASFQTEENPIFLYFFDYHGEFSYLNSFGILETYGATHADELQYIMNQKIFYSNIVKGTEDDYMIGKMSEMWANFGKIGNPKHSSSNTWEPLGRHIVPTSPEERRSLKYYHISKTGSKMIDEPFKSRMAFWESLQCDDF